MDAGSISVAVLAAGAARRMGRPKLLLEIGGEAIVRRVVRTAVAVSPGEILVVASPDGREALAASLDEIPVRIVVNERAAEGLGSSIALAASQVSASAEAMILLQADQPLVEAPMLETLIAEWRSSGSVFVASSYEEVVTTPVLFSRELFGELRALGGERGARRVLDRHAGAGRVVAFPADRGRDVDTLDDYHRILELATPAGEATRSHG